MWQRFVFRFWNREAFREESVTILGTNYQEALADAWRVLGTTVCDPGVRAAWRLTSTDQRPVWAWLLEQDERDAQQEVWKFQKERAEA